ncbi:hypothetical protein Chor_012196 [Crotalus horridus]
MNLLFLLFFFIHVPPIYLMDQKALEDYVNLPDLHYSYTLVSKEEHHDSTVYTINMTSVKWLDDSEVDKTIWWHMVTIAVPKVYKNAQMKKSCFLLLAGGRNDDSEEPAEYSADQIRTLAVTTGSLAVLLMQIPFQPLTFYKHPFGMKNITENSLFAYVLWRFINDPTSSLDWAIQFPMVKATVRAMDTVTDFLLKQTCEDVQITEFMLLGSSKRGWIAWLTAAIDKRVVSFVSVVMDVLNFVELTGKKYLRIIPNMNHALAFYGDSTGIPIATFYLITMQNQQHPQVHWNRTVVRDILSKNSCSAMLK